MYYIVRSNITEMGMCLNYWDLVYDVKMDLYCISFRIFFIINKIVWSYALIWYITFIRPGLHPILVEIRSCCMFSETPCIYAGHTDIYVEFLCYISSLPSYPVNNEVWIWFFFFAKCKQHYSLFIYHAPFATQYFWWTYNLILQTSPQIINLMILSILCLAIWKLTDEFNVSEHFVFGNLILLMFLGQERAISPIIHWKKMEVHASFPSSADRYSVQYSSRVLGQKRDRTRALLALYSG